MFDVFFALFVNLIDYLKCSSYLGLWICFMVFFSGAIITSGVECCGYRHAKGISWMKGKSRCENCGVSISVIGIIPVFGALIYRGKCPKCGYHYGYKYAVSEFIGGLAMLCYFLYRLTRFSLFIFCLIIFIYIGFYFYGKHLAKE